MFNNLIESQSHRKELKRQTKFVVVTTAAYALLLFVAGIGSIYAYDARLDSQNTDLDVLSWVPPVATAPATPLRESSPAHTSFTPTARVDPRITTPERQNPTSTTADPNNPPDRVGVTGTTEPPVAGPVTIGNRNVDPPGVPNPNPNNCTTCRGDGKDRVNVPLVEAPPAPTLVTPKPKTITSTVLASRAISLPQPPYPAMARQIHVQGPVSVQILVDVDGRVVSAHAVGGHPFLIKSAEEAALRARFTPTKLNGEPVKVQGLITYNFVLQ